MDVVFATAGIVWSFLCIAAGMIVGSAITKRHLKNRSHWDVDGKS